MCKACSNYEKQSELIEKALSKSEINKIEIKDIQEMKTSNIKIIAESK